MYGQAKLAYADNGAHKVRFLDYDSEFTTQLLYRLGYHWPFASWDYVERFVQAINGFVFLTIMEKRRNYLVNKAFNSFLLASVLTVAATQVGATVDGMMLSYLIGEQAMSSVNICRPVMQLLFALCMLIGAGSSMLVGVAIGNRDRVEANRVFTGMLCMIGVLGVVFLCMVAVCLPSLVDFLCPSDELHGVTSEYLSVTLYSAIFYMLSVCMEMFVAVDGSPKRVSVAVCACALTNVVFDYVFIAIAGWGVTGAAWATVISYVVSVLLLLPHFLSPGTLRLAFGSCLSTIVKSLSAGLPFGMATMLIAVQLWGCNRIAISYLGNEGIVALSVCFYLLALSMIILSGTLKTFQPVASILKGAGDERGVLMVIEKAYRFMAVCFVFFTLPLVLAPQQVAVLFGISNPALLAATTKAIPPYALNIIFQCMVYLLIPIYQLYGNKSMATFVSVSQSLAPLLGMWLLVVIAPDYVWWGFALGQLVVLALVVVFAAFKHLRNPNLTQFLLIPRREGYVGFETSLPLSMEAMDDLLLEVNSFLKQHGIEETLIMHVEVSSEELLKNIITHGYDKQNKKRFIDYRLSLVEGQVRVVISDDGKAFNPLEYDKKTGIGLLLVKGLCTTLKYDYLFQQNMVTLTYHKKSSMSVV